MSVPQTEVSPGARRRAAWGMGNALRYRRARDWLLSVTQRAQKAPSSAIPPPRSDPLSTLQNRVAQQTQQVEATDCPCAWHRYRPACSKAAGSLPSGWQLVLVISMLLTSIVTQHAFSGRLIAIWAAAVFALVTGAIDGVHRQMLAHARGFANDLWLWLPVHIWEPQSGAMGPYAPSSEPWHYLPLRQA
jgi:hypothetical protein